MPSLIPQKAQTEGSSSFDPDKFFEAWSRGEIAVPNDDDFHKFVLNAFGLKSSDSFIYRATAEVTLAQAQAYLAHGGQGRLHEWYRDEEGEQVGASLSSPR